MKPVENLNVPYEILGYIDIEYSGYNYTQKRVTIYSVLTNRVVVAWYF